MVACADCDAEAVEQRAEVEGVDIAHVERDDGFLLARRAVYLHTRDKAHLFHGVAREGCFVRGNDVLPDAPHVVQSHGEGVRADKVGRACLKLERQPLVSSFLKRHAGYHLAAALIWRHLFQKFLAAVKHADARRPIYFMARKGEEVATDVLHVHAAMGHALRSVHQHLCAVGVGDGSHFFHGVHRTEHIAHVGDAYEPRAR